MDKTAYNPSKAVARSPAWAVTGQGAGGGGGVTTWEERVGASHDDGYWDDMMGFDNTADFVMVDSDEFGTMINNSFFRFASVEVPQGSTITEATLELIMASGASSTFNMTVRAEVSDNAAQYTDSTDASDVTDTTAGVTWTGSSSWSADEVVQSPDIKTVIEEVTDRSGWSSGNALTVRLHYAGSSGPEAYSFKSYDDASSVAAKLTIKYS